MATPQSIDGARAQQDQEQFEVVWAGEAHHYLCIAVPLPREERATWREFIRPASAHTPGSLPPTLSEEDQVLQTLNYFTWLMVREVLTALGKDPNSRKHQSDCGVILRGLCQQGVAERQMEPRRYSNNRRPGQMQVNQVYVYRRLDVRQPGRV